MSAPELVQKPETRRVGKTPFEIVVDEKASPPVLALHGDVDVAVADKLDSELTRLLEAGYTQIVIDCADVTYFDSTGLSVLVAASRMLERQKLQLIHCIPRLIKLLQVTGLDNVFEVSLPEAA